MPNVMGSGPRPIGPPRPPNHFAWQIPAEKGLCNLIIYRYFVVNLAQQLGMQFEDGNGRTIPKGYEHELEYEVTEVNGQKRAKFSFTLTE